MSAPQSPADNAAMRQRRRWLARRRSLRALRATLAFIVLVTPFCYFGFLLCCHMPPGFRRGLPNLILLYEWWMFFRNGFVLLRNVWFSPVLAVLPLVVNLVFIAPYPPGDARKINRDLYFELFRQDRLDVIRQIEQGTLPGIDYDKGYSDLPDAFSHTAFPRSRVSYSRNSNEYTVLFQCGWTALESYQGFVFNEESDKETSDTSHQYNTIDTIAPKWHYIEY